MSDPAPEPLPAWGRFQRKYALSRRMTTTEAMPSAIAQVSPVRGMSRTQSIAPKIEALA